MNQTQHELKSELRVKNELKSKQAPVQQQACNLHEIVKLVFESLNCFKLFNKLNNFNKFNKSKVVIQTPLDSV